MAEKRFVKSADTKAPVGNSLSELERILRRYGCGSLGVEQDYERGFIRVRFTVPDRPGDKATIPVELHIEISAVYRRLYDADYPPPSRRDRASEQAERVTWRHLVLWVDAALSAAEAGLQPLSEAFFAHTLICDQRGEIRRVVDHFSAVAPGGNWKALLPPPTP